VLLANPVSSIVLSATGRRIIRQHHLIAPGVLGFIKRFVCRIT